MTFTIYKQLKTLSDIYRSSCRNAGMHKKTLKLDKLNCELGENSKSFCLFDLYFQIANENRLISLLNNVLRPVRRSMNIVCINSPGRHKQKSMSETLKCKKWKMLKLEEADNAHAIGEGKNYWHWRHSLIAARCQVLRVFNPVFKWRLRAWSFCK